MSPHLAGAARLDDDATNSPGGHQPATRPPEYRVGVAGWSLFSMSARRRSMRSICATRSLISHLSHTSCCVGIVKLSNQTRI